MCRTREQRNELMRFENSKFTFKLSANALSVRGLFATKTHPVSCAFCGAVKIASNACLSRNASRCSDLFFCDNECAGEHKKIAYRKEPYQNKIRTGERLRYDLIIKLAASVRQRQKHWSRSFREYLSPKKQHERCCVICGVFFRTRKFDKILCSNDACRQMHQRMKSKTQYQSGVLICKECGKEHYAHRNAAIRKFCSSRCMRKNMKDRRDDRTKAVVSFFKDRITLAFFYKKQKGKCACCRCYTHMPINGTVNTTATLDHIVPLARGGWHIRSNMQMLCCLCNSKKQDKITDGTQMMLPLACDVTQYGGTEHLTREKSIDGHDHTRQPALKMNFGEAV